MEENTKFDKQVDNVNNRSETKEKSKFQHVVENAFDNPVGSTSDIEKKFNKFDGDKTQKINNTKEKIAKGAKKVLNAIGTFKYPILFTTIIIFLLYIFICNSIGMAQTAGSTPHFYCDVNAPMEVKQSAVYRQYCTKGGNADNSSIAASAVTLATVDLSAGCSKIKYKESGMVDLYPYKNVNGYTVDTFIDTVPKIIDVADSLNKTTSKWGADYYASCDLTVALAVWWAGADDNFPALLGGTTLSPTAQYPYLALGGDGKWVRVPQGDPVQPGDIALHKTHIWMYLGTWDGTKWTENDVVQEKFPGSIANRFEGSHKDYYAKISYQGNPWSGAEYIYRFAGEIDESSPIKAVQP